MINPTSAKLQGAPQELERSAQNEEALPGFSGSQTYHKQLPLNWQAMANHKINEMKNMG
jgi:hypothetical protein